MNASDIGALDGKYNNWSLWYECHEKLQNMTHEEAVENGTLQRLQWFQELYPDLIDQIRGRNMLEVYTEVAKTMRNEYRSKHVDRASWYQELIAARILADSPEDAAIEDYAWELSCLTQHWWSNQGWYVWENRHESTLVSMISTASRQAINEAIHESINPCQIFKERSFADFWHNNMNGLDSMGEDAVDMILEAA